MRAAAVVVVAATLVLPSCATREPLRGQEAPATDRKLSTFAFIEEGDLASLIVSTKATRYRGKDPYVPLELCLANRGLKKITLTRESFTLLDADGRRYPCAGPRELMERYDFLDLDRRLMELEDIVFHRFANFVRYDSKFSPTRTPSPDPAVSNLVHDRVTLPEFGYLIDLIYFPKPESGLVGKPLELFVSAPELRNPIFVKFVVQ